MMSVAVGRRFLTACIALGTLAVAWSCASVRAPSGGPVDKTPPSLLAAVPDSGAVSLSGTRTLRLLFSEKMQPQPAESFLYLYPEIEIARTKWYGRREVEIRLSKPLPPDTVVIVEVGPNLKDVHKVASDRSYRFPIATAAAFPDGELYGQLVHRDQPLPKGVVELYDVPPDTLEYFRQRPLRRAETDSLGQFRLPWLPVPGGPWLVRAFADGNGDLKLGEREAQRLLPEPVGLDSLARRRNLGLTVLFDPDTPGRLIGRIDSSLAWAGKLLAWSMKIAEEDTGWAPAAEAAAPSGLIEIPEDRSVVLEKAGPGLVRVIFFVDADADGKLSVLPAAGAARADSSGFWEPYAVVDSVQVEPGLDADLPAPRFAGVLKSWQPARAGGRSPRSGEGGPQ